MPRIWQQDQRAVGDTFCSGTSGLGEFLPQWMKTVRSNSAVLEPEAPSPHHFQVPLGCGQCSTSGGLLCVCLPLLSSCAFHPQSPLLLVKK